MLHINIDNLPERESSSTIRIFSDEDCSLGVGSGGQGRYPVVDVHFHKLGIHVKGGLGLLNHLEKCSNQELKYFMPAFPNCAAYVLSYTLLQVLNRNDGLECLNILNEMLEQIRKSSFNDGVRENQAQLRSFLGL